MCVTVNVKPKRAKTAGESNVLATLKEGGLTWVPSSFGWNTNRTARIEFSFDAGAIAKTIDPTREESDQNHDYISITAAHEFGHVLGLMDAYGAWYQPQAPLHRVSEINEDKQKMFKQAERNIMWGGLNKPRDTEITMLLYAWKENRMQGYSTGFLGINSKAFYPTPSFSFSNR